MIIIYGHRFIGKKNLRTRVGTCSVCGQIGPLSEYDTSRWFTLYWIPCIPQGKYHVVDRCAQCDQAMMFGQKQWRQVAPHGVEDCRQAYMEAPTDPAVAIALVNALTATGRLHEDWNLIQDALQRFPRNVDLLLAVGTAYATVGMAEKVDSTYEMALKVQPNHPLAMQAVARRCIERGDLARAQQLLDGVRRQGETVDPMLYELLGLGCQRQERHEEAVEAFRHAVEGDAALGRDKAFRRAVKKSERLGLTAAPSMLPTWNPLRSRAVWVCAGIAAVILAVFGAVNIAETRSRVHVVNGLSRPVSATFEDGTVVTVPAGDRQLVGLPAGSHTARLTDNSGHQEEVTFRLPKGFSDSVHVLNAFGSAALVQEEVPYTSKGKSDLHTKAEATFHLGRRFETFGNVSVVFEEMPKETSTSARLDVVYLNGVNLLRRAPEEIVPTIWANRLADRGDVIAYAEAHLVDRPESRNLLEMYVSFMADDANLVRAEKFLARNLDRRPILVDWHRMWQEVKDRNGAGKDLVARYDDLLAREPKNSQLLYLAGRLRSRHAEAMGFYDRAIAADANNAYPYRARAYHLVSSGDFSGARASAQVAAKLWPDDAQTGALLDDIDFALRDFDSLEKRCRAGLQKEAGDYRLGSMLIAALAAKGDLPAARAAYAAYAAAVNPDGRRDVPADVAMRLVLKEMTGDTSGLLSLAKELNDENVTFVHSVKYCLEQESPGEAARCCRETKGAWRWDMLTSICFGSRGEAKEAKTWRDIAMAKLGQGDASQRAMADMLAEGNRADSVAAMETTAGAEEKVMFLVALVQAGADRKLLDLAEKLNYHPGSPQRLLKKAIAKLREGK
jgi:tetratricopeptide (TPR) repeat protein